MNDSIKVEKCPEIGRYLISTKNLSVGDIIIEENPFAYGPKVNTTILCLGCYCPLDNGPVRERCSKCKWPLCGNCDEQGAENHCGECEVFCNNKVKFYNCNEMNKNSCPQLDCITPLRVLLAKEKDPERWEKEIAVMEDHKNIRIKQEDIWNADLVNVARYLRGPCKLQQFPEELIMKVIGILEVNTFEAKTSEGYPIRCLYPITSILAHNCVPNTARSIYPSENFRIRLRALVPIEKDHQLLHSYTYTLNGTAARQAHLKSGKYFTCRCDRCSDPTELGTHFSSLKCTKCDSGFITTTNPFDESAGWKCSCCENEIPSDTVQSILSTIQLEVEGIQAMECGRDKLEKLEILLQKYHNILHPSHFIQTNIKQDLIELYERFREYEKKPPSTLSLENRKKLCQDILTVLNTFEPGLSRSRAILLYQLYRPLILLAKSAHAEGVLDNQDLKLKFQEAIDILEECVNILRYEDSTTLEGNLKFIAKQELERLKSLI